MNILSKHKIGWTIGIVILAVTTLLSACGSTSKPTQSDMVVTIAPLKYIVEGIVGSDFQIEIMVPTGASPESYEPTPKQYIRLNEAKLIFSTGLIDFETAMLNRLSNKNVVNLSNGIELIEGSCSHNHSGKHRQNDAHAHGIDPHIWTSPRELKIMTRNTYDAVKKLFPDSMKYDLAYEKLITEIEALDAECEKMCRESEAKAFAIYHPALTYLSRAYGIEQIAIEDEGKEPSAKHLADIIEQAKAKNVKCLLYQKQYPRSVVEVVGKDMGVDCVEFDPLAENTADNIKEITRTITSYNE